MYWNTNQGDRANKHLLESGTHGGRCCAVHTSHREVYLRSMKNSKFHKMIRKINWYPPYLGAGIRVKSVDQDMTRFEVELRARWYNRNLFGTHFGGSMYAMADPFFLFICISNLGKDFIVWDKSAKISFLKPAKGTILGVFEIEKIHLSKIRQEVMEIGKNTYRFEAYLTDEQAVKVAHVSKEIYVRYKLADDRMKSL